MSYRTFKRLLGETSLERKCRFIFGTGILILISASFYWGSRRMEQLVDAENRSTGRILVWSVFFKHHQKLFERMDDFRPVIDEVFDDLAPKYFKDEREATAGDWYRLVLASGAKYPPHNDFEQQAMQGFRGGKNELFRKVPVYQNGEYKGLQYQYVGAVRAATSCVNCHGSPTLMPPVANPGDLMAAVSIYFPPSRDVQNNRAILITMALLTVLVGMTGSYTIVRYVIVRPVKQLKEVSDVIASGNVDVRADIQTGDEFEELSHAFNRMLRNLVAMQEELRGVNRELDRKVDELAQANMALFETNRIKSDFLATMSHELRTPLNSVIGFSEVLASNDKLTEKERRYATNIQSAGRQLLTIINDLLDLAKIEAGKMEMHVEEFSIRDVIEGLVHMSRPIAERKNIDVTFDVSADVPLVSQDGGKIRQILYNLLSNAIKFTPEGGRVKVQAGCHDADLVLAIEDTGVGIPPEEREHIFEKFRQGGRVQRDGESSLMTREHQGTGLGLSIVRELCRMLGGDVSLQSELGAGSTFTVRVPLRLKGEQQVRVPLSDERIDLSKARRIDPHRFAATG
jgi:signal transduction histidine kinase